MSTRTPFQLLTHPMKVCRLYRAALRCVRDHHPDRVELRIQSTLLRARFDENKNERNLIKAKQMLIDGENELEENKHPIPAKWPSSVGGTEYDRYVVPPDYCLDFWDPMEKARYPYYFAKREQRKKEYIEQWEEQYGKRNIEDLERHH